MKVVLLGGTGFVGKNVLSLLKQNGLEVHVLSRSMGLDLRNPAETGDYLKKLKPDYIVNCAANVGSLNYVTTQAADVIVDNTQMLIGMYQAIASSYPSSTVINPIANCAYPAKADSFIEDAWWDGHLHRSVLSYGATRRLMWSISECFAMQHGVRTISLLVPNMYGPNDSTNPDKAHALNALVSKFVKAKHENARQLQVWGTGIAIREWLYAPDFARIILEIIKNPSILGLDEPLNIAQNFGLSVREIIGVIQRHFDYKLEIEFDPTKPDGAPKKVMDDARFRKIFPNFNFTKFDDGVPKTIEYYQSVLPY